MKNNPFQRLFPRPALAASGPGGDQAEFPTIYLMADPPKRTVQGERRRPGSDRPSAGRVESPPRRDQRPSGSSSGGGGFKPPSGGGGGYTPSGGGYTPSGGGGGGGGFGPLIAALLGGLLFKKSRGGGGGGGFNPIGCGILVLLVICGGIFLVMFAGGALFSSGGGGVFTEPAQNLPSANVQPSESLPTIAPLPTQAPAIRPTSAPSFAGSTTSITGATGAAASSLPAASLAAATPGQTWTIMLYQDGDDKVLEQDIFIDFNEAEKIGSSDRVNIVSQFDRYVGGFRGDGDWSDTRRFYLQQDNDLDRINSPYESIGEKDMSNPQTLVDFIVWAATNYPADKYVLIMSDHGMGWPGGWTDPEPPSKPTVDAPIARAIGSAMYLSEIDWALGEARRQTGIDAFELVGMDACLMAHMEVFAALAPHARFATASQEVEPAVGWAYASFLDQLARNPDVTGRELGQWIVDSYIVDDLRVTDANARAQFVGRSGISAQQLANQLEQNITISTVDLSQMPAAMEGLNRFALTLQNTDQRTVAKARNYAQSFTSVFGSNVAPSYIDLAHFSALLVRESGDPAIRSAVEEMFGTFQNMVVAERNGPKAPGATGLSIYFPNSQLYGSAAAGPASYVPVSERFAGVSLWDDFLNFHYTGRTFQDTAGTLVVPDRSTDIVAPGAGTLSLSPLIVDKTSVAPGDFIAMSADVDGDNLGYIYLFAGFYDRQANSINVIDMDFIDSGDTREVNGVFYPDWGEGAFTLEFDWEPIVFGINDGQSRVLALLEPHSYGESSDLAVYTVQGMYTYADGTQRRAQLIFSDGQLQQVVGFMDERGETDLTLTAAPREITPSAGDTFTVYERWYDLDSNGRFQQVGYEEGGTLIFGDTVWTYDVLDGPAGDYAIGYIVEDLDGNRVETYIDVNVQ